VVGQGFFTQIFAALGRRQSFVSHLVSFDHKPPGCAVRGRATDAETACER
jgi:hypothetical protein